MTTRQGLLRRGPAIGAIAAATAVAAAVGAVAALAGPADKPEPVISVEGGGFRNASGTVFAKQGQTVTVKVTGNNVACVTFGTSTDHEAPFERTLTAPAGNGQQSLAVVAYPDKNKNNVCNGSSVSGSAAYQLDNEGPRVGAELNPAPNGAGWNKQNVLLSWSAADDGAGVAPNTITLLSSSPGSAGATTESVTANTDSGGTARSATARDNLGNVGTGSVTVRLDKAAPAITASRTPVANGNGWSNSDVTVSFSCSDGNSGIRTGGCAPSRTLTADGADQTVTGDAADVAGNTATTSVSVSIDKTPPTLAGTPQGTPTGGWYSGDVTVAWDCADGLSGVGNCPAASTITGEGTGLGSSRSVADRAGNTATATSSPAVRIDRTAPVTTVAAPSGWQADDAQVVLSAMDAGSGVAGTFYRIGDGASQTYDASEGIRFSADGAHELTFWSTDAVGHAEAARTIVVRVDKTAPSITHALSTPANAHGWHRANVTVTFSCGDATSGVAFCSAPGTVSDEGAGQALTGEARDDAGNRATSTAVVSLDKTAPSIAAAADRAPNGAGWYRDDVVVSFTCDDDRSGIASGACPGEAEVGEGADQALERSVEDAAGNAASARLDGINVDKTAPAVTGAPVGEPNGAGWYRDDVQVSWACSDDLSRLAEDCPQPSIVDGEGDDLGTGTSVADHAGNVGTGSVGGIRIDRTRPVTRAVLPDAVADGWHAGPIDVELAAGDNLSGVAATYYSIDAGPRAEYDGAFRFDRNGTHELTFWSVDVAGNVEDAEAASQTVEIKIDTVDPTIRGSRSPEANAAGWNNGPVVVTFACRDDDSGPESCTDPVTLDREGAGQSAEGTVTDRVGNSASTTLGDVNIDLTPPSVSGTPAGEGRDGWFRGDVTVSWECDDALSGVAACPDDSIVDGEGRGLGTESAAASDHAGNAATGSISGIRIDRTAPSVAIDAPAAGTSVSTDQVTVTVTAADAGSGVEGVTVNGQAATDDGNGRFSRTVALACGANTITARAADVAGHRSATDERTVNRSCATVGPARSPIATSNGSQGDPKASNLSAFKIRSVVPVKFQVFTDANRTQLITTPPAGSTARLTVYRAASAMETIDQPDFVSGTANSGDAFRWSGSPDHQYVFNLATSGRTAGTYAVELTLYAADGTTVLARSAKQYFVLRS